MFLTEDEEALRGTNYKCCVCACVYMHVWLYVSSVVVGTLTCSKVAKVSVCPLALVTLREKVWAFGQETRRSLLKEDALYDAERWQETSKDHQVFALLSKTKVWLVFSAVNNTQMYNPQLEKEEKKRLTLIQLFHVSFKVASFLSLSPQNISEDAELAHRFKEIVQDMEDYLNPLLTQFDFTFMRWTACHQIFFFLILWALFL